MNRTNILYVIDNLQSGGTQQHLIQMARNIDRRKFNPIVCTFKPIPPEMGEKIREASIVVESFELEKIYSLRAIKTALYLKRLLLEENVQIVHTYFFLAHIIGTIAARLARAPVVISSRRDMAFGNISAFASSGKRKQRMYIATSSFMNRFVDEIVVVSKHLKQWTQSKENVKSDRIAVIYNGIDLQRISGKIHPGYKKKELGIPEYHQVVGVVANLHPWKGHKNFLIAASQVIKQFDAVSFVLVGDGPLRASLEKLAEELGIKDRVIFTGFCDDVFRVLSGLDIFALPSETEGLSNAIIEAMAVGKPVIATRVGGSPELVVDGQTGYLVEFGDINSLSQTILKLLTNRDLATRMGRAGLMRIKQFFTIEAMMRDIERKYETLLSKHSKVLGRDENIVSLHISHHP